jgi:protein-L-isoaspartate(D-aspartate) O-methyltransferase
LRHADGALGWPEDKTFDAILSAAAPSVMPQTLLAQLADGGVLVIPVGQNQQYLTLVRRNGDEFTTDTLEPVKFVPLLSGVSRDR